MLSKQSRLSCKFLVKIVFFLFEMERNILGILQIILLSKIEKSLDNVQVSIQTEEEPSESDSDESEPIEDVELTLNAVKISEFSLSAFNDGRTLSYIETQPYAFMFVFSDGECAVIPDSFIILNTNLPKLGEDCIFSDYFVYTTHKIYRLEQNSGHDTYTLPPTFIVNGMYSNGESIAFTCNNDNNIYTFNTSSTANGDLTTASFNVNNSYTNPKIDRNGIIIGEMNGKKVRHYLQFTPSGGTGYNNIKAQFDEEKYSDVIDFDNAVWYSSYYYGSNEEREDFREIITSKDDEDKCYLSVICETSKREYILNGGMNGEFIRMPTDYVYVTTKGVYTAVPKYTADDEKYYELRKIKINDTEIMSITADSTDVEDGDLYIIDSDGNLYIMSIDNFFDAVDAAETARGDADIEAIEEQ